MADSSLTDLRPYYDKEEVIRLTVLQINKDFAFFSSGLQPEGSGTPYDRLFRAMVPVISQWLDRDYNRFIALLYRIDIPEPALKQALALRSEDPLAHVIADLIIQRELQKVLLRKKYDKSTFHSE